MDPIHLIAFSGLVVIAISMLILNKKLSIDKDFKPEVKRRYV